MSRPRGADIPATSALYAIVAPLITLAQVSLYLLGEPLMVRAAVDRSFATVALATCALLLAFQIGVAPAVVIQNARRPQRSPGRARLIVLGLGGALHGWASLAAAAVYIHPESARLLESGLGLHAPSGRQAWAAAATATSLVGAGVALAGSIASWFLLSKEFRARCFFMIDALLLVLVTWAVITLPTAPKGPTPEELVWPIVRHVLVTLGVIRLTIRLMPLLLNLIETQGFRQLVAARHLRAKKSGFLAAISLLSVGAVTVSCVALTVTLSIMGGFRNDLKRKILGNNAHIVIDREEGQIQGWEALLSRVREAPHVAGAAPFVSGEVMLSSASNLATAVLRGIDTQSIGSVNDLPNNLTNGKLEYLDDPEKLRDLPADLMRSPILRLGDDPSPNEDGEATLADADADAGLADLGLGGADAGVRTPAEIAADADRLEQRIAELDRFLRDPGLGAPTGAAAERPPRELLPGIIIGQELARALRLFVGDEVNVVAPLGTLGPSGPMPKARPFRVAGIFYSGMYEYDMKFTYVALPRAQAFLGTGDAIRGIEVRVDDLDQAPAAAASIRKALGRPELRVRDWQELNSRLFGALALEKLAMFVALGIAIVVASFCIIGTLTLMVQEKGREVAILKAMGSPDGSIVGVFVIEGGLIGMLGAALGLFLGYMLCFAAEHFGVRLNPEVYYIDRLPVHIDPTEFALTGVAAVAVCLFVTIYPALLASRLRPVDALRYE